MHRPHCKALAVYCTPAATKTEAAITNSKKKHMCTCTVPSNLQPPLDFILTAASASIVVYVVVVVPITLTYYFILIVASASVVIYVCCKTKVHDCADTDNFKCLLRTTCEKQSRPRLATTVSPRLAREAPATNWLRGPKGWRATSAVSGIVNAGAMYFWTA